jgi:hypothetical protein
LQYKDFNTEPSEEETEYAKWEGYKALVLKMRSQVATFADVDGAEEGDAESDDVEVGDDAEDVRVPIFQEILMNILNS